MWKFALILVSFLTTVCPDQAKAQSTTLSQPPGQDVGSGDGEKVEITLNLGSNTGELLSASILPPTCTAEYRREADHTMCLQDDPRVAASGVSALTQRNIVALHNSLRGQVHPPATDLSMVTWDENLAAIANKWAKQCVIGHDSNRKVPSYGMFIGQNVAAGHRSWEEAIMSWYNEVQLYQYGQDPNQYLGRNGWKKIGHYTQMVQNDTYRIGCGYANCRRTSYGRYYVCNYAKGQSRLSFPYTQGIKCSACPNSCWKGLCDCDGMMCLNQGQMNPDTCTCTCPAIFAGSNCSILNCPTKDPFYCGRDLVIGDCKVYANVPHLCPYMCGVCGEKSDVGATTKPAIQKTTEPPPFISPFNCSYKGLRGTPEECKSYGDRGMDMGFCGTRGGKFKCDDCTRYYNIKRDYCPVMCGLCDPICGGKDCLHEGKLDPDTCQCNCTKLYSGDTCATLTCPPEDKWHCNILPKRFCNIYQNVPTDCPFMCGICTNQEGLSVN